MISLWPSPFYDALSLLLNVSSKQIQSHPYPEILWLLPNEPDMSHLHMHIITASTSTSMAMHSDITAYV